MGSKLILVAKRLRWTPSFVQIVETNSIRKYETTKQYCAFSKTRMKRQQKFPEITS